MAFPVASSNTTVPTLSPAESTVLNSSYQSMDRRLDEHSEWCDAVEVSGSPSLSGRSSCKQLEGIRHSAKAKDGRTRTCARTTTDGKREKGEGMEKPLLPLSPVSLRLSFSFPLPMEGGRAPRRVGRLARPAHHTTPNDAMCCHMQGAPVSNLRFLQLLCYVLR